ncbi:MAG: DUF2513 domain-containing protein [Shewanella sp.]
MKVDLDYMGKILSVFTELDRAHATLHDFAGKDLPLENEHCQINQKLLFHIQIAIDNCFLGTSTSNTIHNLKDIGISATDTELSLSIRQIRLTQRGHDFAKTLQNKEVLIKLKTEFKDAPFNVIFDGGQKLLQHYFKKKLDALLDE